MRQQGLNKPNASKISSSGSKMPSIIMVLSGHNAFFFFACSSRKNKLAILYAVDNSPIHLPQLGHKVKDITIFSSANEYCVYINVYINKPNKKINLKIQLVYPEISASKVAFIAGGMLLSKALRLLTKSPPFDSVCAKYFASSVIKTSSGSILPFPVTAS